MTITLQQWGIVKGLEFLADADREFDHFGIRTALGEDGLEVFDAVTDFRKQVRQAIREGEADLLPPDGETCRIIARALQVLLDAGCLDYRTGRIVQVRDALLKALATLHLVVTDDDDDGGGGDEPEAEPPPSEGEAKALEAELAQIIAGVQP